MTEVSRISQQKKEIIMKSTELLRAVTEAIGEIHTYIETESTIMKENAGNGDLIRAAIASGRSTGAIECSKILVGKLIKHNVLELDKERKIIKQQEENKK